MTVLFVAGERGDGLLDKGLTAAITSSHYRSGFARTALGLTATLDSTLRTPVLATSSVMGCRFYLFTTGFAVSDEDMTKNEFLRFYPNNSTTTCAFAIATNAQNGLEVRTQTSFQIKAASQAGYTVPANTLLKVDCIAHMAQQGYVRVYIDDVLVVDWTGDTRHTGATGYNSVEWTSTGSTLTAISEIAICNTDTRDIAAVSLMPPQAVGRAQGWAGSDVSRVNKTNLNDATSIGTNTTPLVSYTLPDVYSGEIQNPAILAMVATARSLRGDPSRGSPQKLRLGLYDTDFNPIVQEKVLAMRWDNFQAVFPTNPVTGGVWSVEELVDLEVAVGTVL